MFKLHNNNTISSCFPQKKIWQIHSHSPNLPFFPSTEDSVYQNSQAMKKGLAFQKGQGEKLGN